MTKTKALPSQKVLNNTFNYFPEIGVLVWKSREDKDSQWNGRMAGKMAGHIDKNGYVYTKIDGSKYAVHRLIWALFHGPIPKGKVIDHIDGNPSNNKINNLRLATTSQNQMNRVSDIGRNFKGVYKSGDGFKAEITNNEGRVYIGSFDCEIKAAKAYDKKARELHGDFARLNFPKLELVS